eukprot:1829441-Pyramimonas_sp.AAC.1
MNSRCAALPPSLVQASVGLWMEASKDAVRSPASHPVGPAGVGGPAWAPSGQALHPPPGVGPARCADHVAVHLADH